jgi:hypothetical protein
MDDDNKLVFNEDGNLEIKSENNSSDFGLEGFLLKNNNNNLFKNIQTVKSNINNNFKSISSSIDNAINQDRLIQSNFSPEPLNQPKAINDLAGSIVEKGLSKEEVEELIKSKLPELIGKEQKKQKVKEYEEILGIVENKLNQGKTFKFRCGVCGNIIKGVESINDFKKFLDKIKKKGWVSCNNSTHKTKYEFDEDQIVVIGKTKAENNKWYR